MKSRYAFAPWILFALVIRIISAATHSKWNHPDEWYQTVEFSNLIWNHVAAHTQEISLHMRNLSWPVLLTLPLGLAQFFRPESIGIKIFLIQFFVGLLDLAMLWGLWQCWRQSPIRNRISENFFLALIILPWFSVADSIRPSQEHLATIALWVCLGMLSNPGRKPWSQMLAGFFAVAIGAFKYPAGLLSLGIALAVGIHALKVRKTPLFFGVGTALGLFAFGLSDAWIYGRPWESLWMYLQFNVFTQLSAKNFGTQPAGVYFEFFTGRWGALAFLFFPLAVAAVAAGVRGILRLEPWAWALMFYVAGHILIGHKEPRFMAPIELLLYWGALQVLSLIPQLRLAVVVLAIPNLLLFTRSLWGETWTANDTYFEIDRHLKSDLSNRTCAVISVRKPLSLDLPTIPFGYFPSERRQPSFDQLSKRPLIWIEEPPKCTGLHSVLLHLHKPDPRFAEKGCRLLPSGILSILPFRAWDFALRRNWVSGPWYWCPDTILPAFTHPESRRILMHEFRPIDPLPDRTTTGERLMRLEKANTGDPNVGDGTLGDW